MSDGINIELKLYDPRKKPPPFRKPILVALGSSLDQGFGFQRHIELKTVKIQRHGPGGDPFTPEELRRVEAGEIAWDDVQFELVDTTLEDELYAYSDSIELWAELPKLPV